MDMAAFLHNTKLSWNLFISLHAEATVRFVMLFGVCSLPAKEPKMLAFIQATGGLCKSGMMLLRLDHVTSAYYWRFTGCLNNVACCSATRGGVHIQIPTAMFWRNFLLFKVEIGCWLTSGFWTGSGMPFTGIAVVHRLNDCNGPGLLWRGLDPLNDFTG